MNRQAQHLIFGSLFAFFLFFLLFTVFFDYAFVNPSVTADRYEALTVSASRTAAALTQSGYPSGWNAANVQRLGLGEEGLLNTTKVASLHQLAAQANGYEHVRELLSVQDDYLITISYYDGTVESVGKGALLSEQALLAANPSLLAAQERLLTHPVTRQPVIITVYLYR